ncbi:MAG TPA: hypothetical protein VME67_16630 [Mycobacterium sp.]|nr:hypothetical protein [Mycobacterium sp.]HTX96338.1 hypothetical protein [Mycobacterium sp.]
MTTPVYGTNQRADVLVNMTADGIDLNHLWDEFRDALDVWNAERQSVTDLLCFHTTATGEAVPQNFEVPSFEQATEYGVPKGALPPGTGLLMGYTFYDYDLAGRFSWKFLRDADSRQVRSVMDSILSADNKLVTGSILRRLFTNTRTRNEFTTPVYDLYDGLDPGPPPYLGRQFDVGTSHFIATGASQIDSADIEDAAWMIIRKGFGTQANSRILILANPDDAQYIMQWRAGEPSRPAEGGETTGPLAKYTYLPSLDSPGFITEHGELVGQQVPGQWGGVKVEGSYNGWLLVQSDFVPSGYVAVVASYGPDHPYNCIGVRQHPNTAYQGLRMLPGEGPYPLVSSYHQRSFGTGIRQRGSAVAIQVTTEATYTPPSAAQIPV